ncbi:MAG: chitobiase/beta-hexosaminidase C-terminal domain-containing protein [Eubacterium sp.]
MKKRILSIVLAICLVLSLVPTMAFAEDSVYVVAGSAELCGSMWNPSDSDNVMAKQADGTYQKVYTDVAVMDGYQFKVVENSLVSEQTWHGLDNGDNVTFNVKSVCDVTITFDPATLKIIVTGDGVQLPSGLNIESMRVVGNGDPADPNWLNGVSWDHSADENLMTEVSSGVYEITYTDLEAYDNYQVKFVANGSWSNNWGGVYTGSGVESDAVYNSSDNITFEVLEDNTDVTIRFNLTDFDYSTKTGAKFTITIGGEIPSVAETTEPSVSVYAAKSQLMDDTFAPDEDGYDTNIGKLAFGINQDGRVQNWYILGKDTGVDGDNTVIFADGSITFGYFENNRDEIKTDTILWNNCQYTGVSPSQVYPNHYGASDIRYGLNVIAYEESRFTPAEQGLMNATKVTTVDTLNNSNYTTTDRLYLLHGDEDEYRIWAGSNNQIPLANESYWNSGDDFWLRTPSVDEYTDVIGAVPGDLTNAHVVNDDGTCARPASNLNLTNVLFSSAVTEKPSNDGPVAGNISSDKAMVLRLDGSSMDIGTVEYDAETDTIKAQKGSISGKVALVVQGKNVVQKQDESDETDWFYSELVNGDYSISADLIKLACGLSSLNLENCKIWLETVGTDEMIYAVGNDNPSSQEDKLLSIKSPSPKTVPNGTSYDDMNLPVTVEIETEKQTETTAPVTWNTDTPASGSYDPNILTEQIVALNGTVTCPDGVNANGVALTATITITISAADTVAAPQADLASGTYTSNQSVKLSSATEGAKIYYTLDGSTPSRTNGIEYTGPISVTGTEAQTVQTAVKAIAVKDKMQDSSVEAFVYTIQIPDTTLPTGEIKIDTNKWQAFFNGITFDLFFKDTQTVTITASDNSGEAVTIEYLFSGEELTLTQLNTATFTAYTGEFSINPDNEYVIYARLTDTSNNVSYINSNGIVLDATAPVISGVENGKTYCEEQTVIVTDKYLDTVTLDGVAITLDASNQFTLPTNGEQTIVATDKSGNKTQITVTVKTGHTDLDGDHICDDCGTRLHKHTGGEATCISKAFCDNCGESYGGLDPDNHTGGTEIRGAKEPTCTEEGYTGDTYCLGCGELLCAGDVIPKLTHTDEDYDHICDICGAKASNHIDNDNDGRCDICFEDIDADSKTETDNKRNENTGKNTSKKSPQTGNDEYALYFAMLLALCGAGIITASVYIKRKKHSRLSE